MKQNVFNLQIKQRHSLKPLKKVKISAKEHSEVCMCFFSLHFRAQAWNFAKSIIRTQKVKFGSDPIILPPDVHFTDQTTGVIGQKKNFSRILLSYTSLESSCSTDKSLQKHSTFIFCFSKVIEVYKLLKSGGSHSFYVKENTKINCICYTSNMFSKLFINQAFKSYTSFDFINTYSRYRLKIIKLWWYIPPENYQITFKTTETFTFQYRRIITF